MHLCSILCRDNFHPIDNVALRVPGVGTLPAWWVGVQGLKFDDKLYSTADADDDDGNDDDVFYNDDDDDADEDGSNGTITSV